MVADPAMVALLFALLLSSPSQDRFAVEVLDGGSSTVNNIDVKRAGAGFDLRLLYGKRQIDANFRPQSGKKGQWFMAFKRGGMPPLPIDLSAELKANKPLATQPMATGSARSDKFTIRRSNGTTYAFVPSKKRYLVIRTPAGATRGAAVQCPVTLKLTANGGKKASTNGKPVTLKVWAHNPSKTPVRMRIPERCPAGAATFDGLPGVDVYDACVAGRCAKSPPTREVTVPAGGKLLLATGRVSPKGTSCSKRLKKGKYTVKASVQTGPDKGVGCASSPVTIVVR